MVTIIEAWLRFVCNRLTKMTLENGMYKMLIVLIKSLLIRDFKSHNKMVDIKKADRSESESLLAISFKRDNTASLPQARRSPQEIALSQCIDQIET